MARWAGGTGSISARASGLRRPASTAAAWATTTARTASSSSPAARAATAAGRARGGTLGARRWAAWCLTRRARRAGARGRTHRRTEPSRSSTSARARGGAGTTGLDARTRSRPTASTGSPGGATRTLPGRPGRAWSARSAIAIASARSTTRAATGSVSTWPTAVAPRGPRDHPSRSGRGGVPPASVAGQAIATERQTAAEAPAGAADATRRATSATTSAATTASAPPTPTGARSAAIATTTAIVAPSSLGHRREVGHVEVLAHLLGGRGRVLAAEHAHQPDVVDPILDGVEGLEQPRQTIALNTELGLNVRPRSLVHGLLQGFRGSGGGSFPRGALRGCGGFQRDLFGFGCELGGRWLGGLRRRYLRLASGRGSDLERRGLGRRGDPGLRRRSVSVRRLDGVRPVVRPDSVLRRSRGRLGLQGDLLPRRNRDSGLPRLLRHLASRRPSRRSLRAMRPANRRGLAQDRVREFRDRFHDGCCTLLVGTGNLRQIGIYPEPIRPAISPHRPSHLEGDPRGGGHPFPAAVLPATVLAVLGPCPTSSAGLRALRNRPWRSW
jgi:hypothetical protein